MKIKNGFIVKQLAGQSMVIAVGEAAKSFRGIVKLNETGLFIWNILENGTDEDAIIDAVLEKYEIDRDRAEKDIQSFLNVLISIGAVE